MKKILSEIAAVIVAAVFTRQLGLAVIHDPDLYFYVNAGVGIGALTGLFAHHFILKRMSVRQLAWTGAGWVTVTFTVYLVYQAVWGDSQSHVDIRRDAAKVLALLLGALGSVAAALTAAAAADRIDLR